MNFEINHIQHVGIPVSDLVVSEAFYNKLGFENVMSSGFDHNGGKGKVFMMKKGTIIMELYQLPENNLQEIRKRKNGHIDHIAFNVADIDKAFAELKSESFNIMETSPVFLPFWTNGCKYFNIIGLDGERLIQPAFVIFST